MSDAELATRLRRIEQQVRAFRDLHASETQLILDQLTALAAELEISAAETAPAAQADPAAASPKRAAWLAEEARRAQPVTRRELLRRARPEDAKT